MKRRQFLRASAAAAAGGSLASAMAASPGQAAPAAAGLEPAAALGQSSRARRLRVLRLRGEAARRAFLAPHPGHPDNGEEARYPSRIASFHKGLPHNDRGEVDPAAYAALIRALRGGRPDDFEAIPMGGPLRLVCPQAAYYADLSGVDSHALGMPPAPRIDSAEGAADLVEDYWMALARDVPFSDFEQDPLLAAAGAELASLAGYTGPRAGGAVPPRVIFRGNQPGCLEGPLVSQFLLLDCPLGAHTVPGPLRTVAPGVDYMTAYGDWLAIQRGAAAAESAFDPDPRYLRSMRDLAEWVHRDFTYLGGLRAALLLVGLGAPLDPGIPLQGSRTQVGFAEFGAPEILDHVAQVGVRALRAAWFQKWLVHRRLRPEAYGGLAHHRMTGAASYPVHPDVLNSGALPRVFSRHGTYLLPQAYPEGSPAHPSYPAGHSTFAAACATVLKAYFDESFIIPNPVVPDRDGFRLLPYTDQGLTVGGELDKLATNISLGRSMAGVHYRSENRESLQLGEQVAIRFLAEQKASHNQSDYRFVFRSFGGTLVTI